MRFAFPYPAEAIVFFSCACAFTLTTLQNEIVYQFVSEMHNYTANASVEYCTANQSKSEMDQIVANDASRWLKYTNAALYASSAFFAFLLTALSDKIGRKWAILFPVLGYIFASTIQAIVYLFRLPLYFLVLSGLVNGSFGSYEALLNIASAYLSDTTPIKDRDKRFVILEVCASFGGGVSMFATGYWVKADGFVPPSYFIIGCAIVALCFVPSMLSEKMQCSTNSPQHVGDPQETEYLLSKSDLTNDNDQVSSAQTEMNVSFLWKLKTIWKNIWRIYTTDYSTCDICDSDSRRPKYSENTPCCHGGGVHKGRIWRIWFYVLSFSLYMVAVNGGESIRTMFFLSYPVCFTPDLVGLQNGLDSGLLIFSPLIVIFYEKVVKFKSQTIILVAIFSRMSAMLIIAFAEGPALVFLSTSLGIFYNFTTAIIRSQITLLVSATEQGSALAALSGIESVINIFSPIAFYTIYPVTLYIFHGFTWIVGSLIICVPFALMIAVWIANKRREYRKMRDIVS